MSFITIENISKTFVTGRRLRHFFLPGGSKKLTRVTALENVSLAIGQGECFGLIGPNGAGKTTLLKILATLVLPDAGSVTMDGLNLQQDREIRKRIGLVTSEERSFYWRLTGRQNLEFFAALHHLSPRNVSQKIQELCGNLEIENPDRPFQEYSTGLKQRFALARALLHDPPILLLDEPTKGLDRLSAEKFRQMIQRVVRERRKTVIYATHFIQEISSLFDNVAHLRRGRLVAKGPWSQISKEAFC
ncbi:MAG: hypothetical protein A2W61_00760 [Deltaproteobacteria bacterium RIFCSPLOWO2_01_44_7]|nr:MAG: hypothetical protein A2712_05805 [Deltaproteobacteria bacterium RIFCSPHIGHO2_01_FULL_43_49]OGQ16645.1 MAG: hypothetical protein A3D22_06930 [Deltaproteobacteria bacterium RIFCSPHIGHO2_02_FULL_44_53]OGQ29783.1 MAG: hypothetical protein A3D98_09595 [Deltaproteobacteria bacterium RIFCSPHIGHO2_12_FULL_44_21]OGQ33073.1 MAG: hypothetical protein A2979_03575 [Deltaproteobacteria bacterium RIFCSPLOWO2_01_FULL_45_74]OGQ37938.1 MAG: hypothetical protein A2W61_00760 [Deltaproteobacteria bacterium 